MQLTEKPALTNALLISICTPDFKGDEAKESLAELARLVTTLVLKWSVPSLKNRVQLKKLMYLV